MHAQNQMKPEEHPEQPEDVTEEAMEEEALAAAEEAADAAIGEAEQAGQDDAAAVIAELKDQLLRAVAETENVRKRAQRDVEESGKYAITGFARDLGNVIENLQRASESIGEEAREANPQLKSLGEGVDMTLRELLSAFEKHGIVRIEPLGQKFDHNFHQAVTQIEDPTVEPGTVLQVMQAGYVIHNRLLRPAMVGVSKQGEAKSQLDTQA